MSPTPRTQSRWLRQGRGLTFLVPYSAGVATDRDRIWAWLRRYWHAVLPGVQVLVAEDPDVHSLVLPQHPFSKSAAVNSAFERATGDIIVIIDADAYVTADLIRYCAIEIRKARAVERPLWFVPYRHFWRLSVEATERVLTSDPAAAWHPDDPPTDADLDPESRAKSTYGSFFAAMLTVMPREAFSGFDPRFNQGWGGEDISFKRQVDTLYSPHKTIDQSVFHLHHGTLGGGGMNRMWPGQTKVAPFALLGARYLAARGDPARMKRLVAEWKDPQPPEEPNETEEVTDAGEPETEA